MALSMAHVAQEMLPVYSTRAAGASGTRVGKSGRAQPLMNVHVISHKRLPKTLGAIETSTHADGKSEAEYLHRRRFS
ncbi:hypothetical protein ACTMU2_08230 [Cupriavidus basilensis]